MRTIAQALNKAGVKCLFAGGFAVVAHGYGRMTYDVDLVLQFERENVLRAFGAFDSPSEEIGLVHFPLTCTCMHYSVEGMRTTIEMTDEQRAKLLHLAAMRGLKGFSKLVQEAIDLYIESRAGRDSEVRAALAVRGVLKGSEADQLAEVSRRIRSTWR